MLLKKINSHAAVKSIAGTVLLLLVFFAVVLAIGYNLFTDALLEQYSDGAYLTATAAAQLIDADRTDAYLQSGGAGEEFLSVWSALDRLCNSSGATFIYVITPDLTDYAHITFVFSTVDHNTRFSEYDVGYVRETTNEEYKQKYRALYDKTADRETVVRDKGYIESDPHITMIVPLTGSDGNVKALLCVQRQMDVLAAVRNRFLTHIFVALAVLILFAIIGESTFLGSTLLRPLKTISEEAIRFSKENTLPETKLKHRIKNKDEIGALADSIDTMEEKVQNYVENITAITAEKERIGTELSLAAGIQADMLPNSFPAFPDRADFDIYAAMDPAKEVGGDFYDFFLIDDDHLCISIADVSGKGVPAALFMMA
ncbi:MAG: SpoIIE family protein phosphatase, partial [Clostridia bacterium]|nr:SpoIIE family protein phosphatase [Clostridia bacterium]